MGTGDNIRALRKERGLTQKELGELCGMADSAIRYYESNRGNPTQKTIKRIATALGVTVDYLLTGEKTEKHPLDWTHSLDKKLNLIGCSLESDELILGAFSDEDNKKWIRLPDCLLMLSDEELKTLDDETDSYLRFKLQELKEKHKDKIKPLYWPLSSPPARGTIGQEQTEPDTAGQKSAEMVKIKKQKKPTLVTEDGLEEIEAYGEMAKNLAMQQFLSEEKPDAQASSAKESDVG